MNEKIILIIFVVITFPYMIYRIKDGLDQIMSTEPNTLERDDALRSISGAIGISILWLTGLLFIFIGY